MQTTARGTQKCPAKYVHQQQGEHHMKKILKEVLVNLLTEAGKALGCILIAIMIQHIPHSDTTPPDQPLKPAIVRV
jgi:hypothetical protein